MAQHIKKNTLRDGIDRRGFLNCMAWAGTGLVWTLRGGVAQAQVMHSATHGSGTDLTFVQISDSHIGFSREPNTDVAATLQAAVDRINRVAPAFVIHTGDISHLSKDQEFDTADAILKGARAGQLFFVPGEHDVLTDNGRGYLDRYGKKTKGSGWFSFDANGVHFAGLVNVLDLKAGGLGSLGREQLDWLKSDLENLSSDTPVVLFAHVPLWTVYEEWGWGTEDGMEALSYLRRFGSATVLNGHIHQTMQKVEGNLTFHTAASTAFPQPAPGSAPSPGPMKVAPDQLRRFLGLTKVQYVRGASPLAIVDSHLDSLHPDTAGPGHDIAIDNFS